MCGESGGGHVMTVNRSYDQCDDTVASVYGAPALSAELN